jgi:hypothetical protein
MGECPPEYPLIAAARYLGVAVWELEERPTAYRDWALVTMEAEARARRDIERRHHRHQRKQR